MKIGILFILLIALGHPSSYGQSKANAKKAAKQTGMLQASAFSESAHEIKTARPEIRNSTLVCDRNVIADVLPDVTTRFVKNGFTEKDSTEAASDGWKIVRLTSPLQPDRCMHKDSFEKLMFNLGKLIFSTTPNEAAIELDGKDLKKWTTHTKWLPPKTYQVKYSKEGYDEIEMSCGVLEGKPTNCHADLTKKN